MSDNVEISLFTENLVTGEANWRRPSLLSGDHTPPAHSHQSFLSDAIDKAERSVRIILTFYFPGWRTFCRTNHPVDWTINPRLNPEQAYVNCNESIIASNPEPILDLSSSICQITDLPRPESSNTMRRALIAAPSVELFNEKDFLSNYPPNALHIRSIFGYFSSKTRSFRPSRSTST